MGVDSSHAELQIKIKSHQFTSYSKYFVEAMVMPLIITRKRIKGKVLPAFIYFLQIVFFLIIVFSFFSMSCDIEVKLGITSKYTKDSCYSCLILLLIVLCALCINLYLLKLCWIAYWFSCLIDKV